MTLLIASYCPAKGDGNMFIPTLTNQLFYYSRLALSIKSDKEYMVALYVNILC